MAITRLNNNSITSITALPSGVGGKILQVAHAESNSPISSTSNIPLDDSVPTSTEGVQILSQSFTPVSSTSSLYFFCTVYCNEDINAGDNIALPIFKGTTFIGMGYKHQTGSPSGDNWVSITFTIKHNPASTSTQTYTLRGGINNGTFESLNTASYMQNSRYGSNIKNTMTIMEIEN